ncbi:tetratricopeptide repeat protein [Nostoc sp.]|uniref:caspase, EACC1-associated type n=1 Tax=Nostoc sp. TaxID=1180 RepID=UPI003593C064
MDKVALLIGVSEYEPGLNPLPAAVKDVEAMQQVLLHPEMGGFAETDIMVLKNPQRQDMEEAIENLFAHRQKDDLLVLFFSGHGIKDDTGRLFLATRSTRKTPRGDLIRSSAVAASIVHESMSRSRSKRQVVILDSCFSGAFVEGLSAKDDGSINIREQLGGEGRAVLTSSSSTQYSFEQQGSNLSIYTRYLIEGITTGAADLDEDGVISIDELHDYASRKVREIQPTMKPEIYTSREGFKIRLTKVPQGDPKQKYRKEVAQYSSRGDVPFVGRKTLDALRSRLGLSEMEATAIEDEMLAVARQEFKQKLQQYQRDFTEALQQQVALSEDDLNALRQNLQQILGLRNEDTMPIEAQIKARITAETEGHQQKLQQYEQVLTQEIQHGYPFGEEIRKELKRYQQVLELRDEEVAVIEEKVVRQRDVNPPLTQVTGEDSKAIPVDSPNKLRLLVSGSIFAVFAVIIIISSILKTPELEPNSESQPSASPSISSTNSPMTAEDLYNRGTDKYQRKDYQGAIEDYNQALKINPNYVHAYNDRGRARYALGYKKEAIEDYNQALKINPNYVHAYNNRGLARYALLDNKEAIEDYNQALKINPNYSIAYNNRGLARYALLDYKEAIEDYSQALKINPNYDIAYNERGNARYALLDYKEAIEDYNQAITINPNYDIAYNNRGLARYALLDYKEAIEDYSQAITINPNFVNAYNGRGLARYALEYKKEAIEDYNQALKINPNYPNAYYNRGNTYSALGDKEQAKKDLKTAADFYQKQGKTTAYTDAMNRLKVLQ